ncbi:MAG: hypothetical protein K6F28_09090 [Lachnospiraceae bacterium]|nr:hypothetical protein [Lachnospiraceae bacterium]
MKEESGKLNGKSINDEELGNVIGGWVQTGGGKKGTPCPKCGKSTNTYKTGKTREYFFGLFTKYEWHCGSCGEDFWLYVSKKER